jgi:four helix bundle protein
MKVERFEQLDVYREARELTNRIYGMTKGIKFAKDFGLTDQIRRASVSVMSNIAEGFERGSTAEFVQFLFIAKGSSGELRSQLAVALDQQYIDEKVYSEVLDKCLKISSMISKFINYLKNSGINKRIKD